MPICYTRSLFLALARGRPLLGSRRLPAYVFLSLSTARLLLYRPTPWSARFLYAAVSSCNGPSRRHGSMALCLLKARSIQNKDVLLADICDDVRPEFFAITETWLTPEHVDSVLMKSCPDVYTALHRPRTSSRGGGVAFLSLNSLVCSRLPDSGYSSFEHLDLLLSLHPLSSSIDFLVNPPLPFLTSLRNYSTLLFYL